ncbi:MAG: hypothetical protein WHU94_10400 [Thermogemmata sp.]|nr:hypothetical protein [Gemmataceae bacterium]
MDLPQPNHEPPVESPSPLAELRRRLLGTPPAAPSSPHDGAPRASAPPPSRLHSSVPSAPEELGPPASPSSPGSGSLPHDSLTRRLKMPAIPVSASASVLGVSPTEAAVDTPLPHSFPSRRHVATPPPVAPYGPVPYGIPYAPPPSGEYSQGPPSDWEDEIARVRRENKELRKLLEEIKGILQEASENEQKLLAKQQDYERQLAEKEALIQELTQHLTEIEEKIEKGELVPKSATPKTRTELEEWADELERESVRLAQEWKKLEEEKRQLREDEEALENQMRHTEKEMAKERAELARQRRELERLQEEIRNQMELIQRGDASLHQQLHNFRRRIQEQ